LNKSTLMWWQSSMLRVYAVKTRIWWCGRRQLLTVRTSTLTCALSSSTQVLSWSTAPCRSRSHTLAIRTLTRSDHRESGIGLYKFYTDKISCDCFHCGKCAFGKVEAITHSLTQLQMLYWKMYICRCMLISRLSAVLKEQTARRHLAVKWNVVSVNW